MAFIHKIYNFVNKIKRPDLMLISADSCVRVWNQQNTTLAYTFDVSVNKINDISFTRDGRILIVGSDSERVQLIDLYKMENPPELVISKNKSQIKTKVTAIGCSSDGQKIGVGTSSGLINVFNTTTHQRIFSSTAHRNSITSITFHPFKNSVIAGDTNGKISFLSLDGGPQKLLPHWSSKFGQVYEFDSSPHKPLLAVACAQDGIVFYDLEKMNKEVPPIPKFTGTARHIRFSPTDPNILAFSSNVNEVFFFNLSSQSLRSPIVFDDNILSMDFRNDGVYLAVSFENTGVVTIDVRDSSIQHKYCTDNTNPSYVVKFQPVDINEDPKFKQTLVSEAPKITRPTIQPSKSNESRKFQAPTEKKKNNTFSRVAQSKNPKNQQKIGKLNDKTENINVNIEKSNSDNYNEIEIDEKIDQELNLDIEEKDNLPQNPKITLASNQKESTRPKITQEPSPKQNTQLKPNMPSPLRKNTDASRSPTRKVESPKEPSSPKQKHNLQSQKQQKLNAHSSPPRPPPQASIPVNAPHIIQQEDESYDEDEIDLSKVPVESREMIKVICNYIKDINETTKEELHQHLNTIHLDILCRIREIEDKLNILMQKK